MHVKYRHLKRKSGYFSGEKKSRCHIEWVHAWLDSEQLGLRKLVRPAVGAEGGSSAAAGDGHCNIAATASSLIPNSTQKMKTF